MAFRLDKLAKGKYLVVNDFLDMKVGEINYIKEVGGYYFFPKNKKAFTTQGLEEIINFMKELK